MERHARVRRVGCLVLAASVLGVACAIVPSRDAGPGRVLPSWRDGPPRAAILDFVADVTDEHGEHYVPPAQRIAVFDNDGTLWIEQPLYVQLAFALDRIAELAPEHPEWREREPFASVLRGDVAAALAGGERALIELVMASHAGMTADEFDDEVARWQASARHPRFDRLYTDLVYQPMVELLAHLRDNGFETYIVSAGGVEFMRAFSEEAYGIPPEQVIGSSVALTYEVREGVPVLVRKPEIFFVDDGGAKPVGIRTFLGRRPIAAFGNSDGDFEMLEWTTSGEGRRLGVLIHHTDDEREYAYDRKGSVGRLDRALDAIERNGWLRVDMKRDWERVFGS